jgi:hypothetical protein
VGQEPVAEGRVLAKSVVQCVDPVRLGPRGITDRVLAPAVVGLAGEPEETFVAEAPGRFLDRVLGP